MSEEAFPPVSHGSAPEAEQRLDHGLDIAYQQREWRVQRIGWVAMALIVVAALLGASGSAGPLATARATASDGSRELHILLRHAQALPANVRRLERALVLFVSGLRNAHQHPFAKHAQTVRNTLRSQRRYDGTSYH